MERECTVCAHAGTTHLVTLPQSTLKLSLARFEGLWAVHRVIHSESPLDLSELSLEAFDSIELVEGSESKEGVVPVLIED